MYVCVYVFAPPTTTTATATAATTTAMQEKPTEDDGYFSVRHWQIFPYLFSYFLYLFQSYVLDNLPTCQWRSGRRFGDA